MKQIIALVGGNGAGKTTFYNTSLKSTGIPFINADHIAADVFPDDPEGHSYEAAALAEKMRREQLQKGMSFCFETVFSHPSKVDFLADAKALGYEINLIFIHVETSALNIARVAQRVQSGGHSVPTQKVTSRIPRTLDNVEKAIPLCDRVDMLDNSDGRAPYRKVLTIRAGKRTLHVDPPPAWAIRFLAKI